MPLPHSPFHRQKEADKPSSPKDGSSPSRLNRLLHPFSSKDPKSTTADGSANTAEGSSSASRRTPASASASSTGQSQNSELSAYENARQKVDREREKANESLLKLTNNTGSLETLDMKAEDLLDTAEIYRENVTDMRWARYRRICCWVFQMLLCFGFIGYVIVAKFFCGWTLSDCLPQRKPVDKYFTTSMNEPFLLHRRPTDIAQQQISLVTDEVASDLKEQVQTAVSEMSKSWSTFWVMAHLTFIRI